jgi:hypothetical protein
MKMKIKHNKKRNTAFLFETLVRELTKSIVEKNNVRSQQIKNILSEHFRQGMVLFSELDCFRSLTDHNTALDHYTAEKMVHQARRAYDELDRENVFAEQSRVIKKINQDLGKETFNNFVPNYKSYATLSQIFGKNISVKSRVLLEKKIIDGLTTSGTPTEAIEPVDSIVVKSFVERFNEKYSDLLPEQRELLRKFIINSGEDSVDFRVYLSEELKRLHSEVKSSLSLNEVNDDAEMLENTNKVINIIEEINVSKVQEQDLVKILKLQSLVREYQDDANQD